MSTVIDARTDIDVRLVGRSDEPRAERLFRRMYFIRRFEASLLELFDTGVLNGTTHACIGQEANAIAVIEHLREGDHLFSNHRCHGHFLAWTGDALGLMAEIMGKPEGVCGGIGGSQHLCAPGFKSNGIQGGIVPTAAGIALAKKLKGGAGDVSAVFIGDGTLGEGAVYETLNIASLWQLPLVIVLEDNGWSQSTPSSANFAGDMRARFDAFGLPVWELDSTDIDEIDAAAAAAISRAREGGPVALIVHTYRLCHHSKNDDNRPEAEVAARWALDPIAINGAKLAPDARAAIEADVEAALADVIERAVAL
jgi:TPP-dependent pyruvate/acetoin dehydrogenase alpha subunit